MLPVSDSVGNRYRYRSPYWCTMYTSHISQHHTSHNMYNMYMYMYMFHFAHIRSPMRSPRRKTLSLLSVMRHCFARGLKLLLMPCLICKALLGGKREPS